MSVYHVYTFICNVGEASIAMETKDHFLLGQIAEQIKAPDLAAQWLALGLESNKTQTPYNVTSRKDALNKLASLNYEVSVKSTNLRSFQANIFYYPSCFSSPKPKITCQNGNMVTFQFCLLYVQQPFFANLLYSRFSDYIRYNNCSLQSCWFTGMRPWYPRNQ